MAALYASRASLVTTLSFALLLSATITGCSSTSDVESTAQPSEVSDTTAGDDSAESSSADNSAEDGAESEDSAPGSGDLSADDVGTATLRVDGVEYPDFTGDCEISRDNGKTDVGDLNDGDIVLIVAIDNVLAHEDQAISYTATNDASFRFRDNLSVTTIGEVSSTGSITSFAELGSRAAEGSRDIVEVRIAGTLDGGIEVDADVVCELQNAF